jgi:hypothetical protein
LFWNCGVRLSQWFQFVSVSHRCEGHSDILTIMLETEMSCFGCFTLVK